MRNIELRPIAYLDASTINRIRNQSADYLHDDKRFTERDTLEWISFHKPDWYSIVLDGEMVGYFRVSNYSEKNRNLYIGADIDEAHRGKGIGYESYLMAMEKLFKERKLNKISLEVLETNERAYNLYRKIGFSDDGTKRQEIWRNGRWVDSIMMSMTRKEFICRYPDRLSSPCIGVCKREGDMCLSCGRTLEQISGWKTYSNEERSSIVSEMIEIKI